METKYRTGKQVLGKTFKSYYVVWKPGTAFELVSHHYPFKSYYVVWKPSPDTMLVFILLRLNRTM